MKPKRNAARPLADKRQVNIRLTDYERALVRFMAAYADESHEEVMAAAIRNEAARRGVRVPPGVLLPSEDEAAA